MSLCVSLTAFNAFGMLSSIVRQGVNSRTMIFQATRMNSLAIDREVFSGVCSGIKKTLAHVNSEKEWLSHLNYDIGTERIGIAVGSGGAIGSACMIELVREIWLANEFGMAGGVGCFFVACCFTVPAVGFSFTAWDALRNVTCLKKEKRLCNKRISNLERKLSGEIELLPSALTS